jgi:hypothetical protein
MRKIAELAGRLGRPSRKSKKNEGPQPGQSYTQWFAEKMDERIAKDPDRFTSPGASTSFSTCSRKGSRRHPTCSIMDVARVARAFS